MYIGDKPKKFYVRNLLYAQLNTYGLQRNQLHHKLLYHNLNLWVRKYDFLIFIVDQNLEKKAILQPFHAAVAKFTTIEGILYAILIGN